MSGKSPAKSPDLRTPKHGRGKLRVGGSNGGAGGRPPDEFKALCQHLASRDETVNAVRQILSDPSHPAYLGALKWATENGYGKPAQPVDVTSQGQRLQSFTLALGDLKVDDGNG